MKIPVLASFISSALLLSARADLTIVQKVEGAGSGNEMTVKIKGDKARIEATPQVSTIMNGSTGELLNLMHSEKKFLRISGERAKAMAEMANKYADGGATATTDKPKLVPTGKKETIYGQETEEYTCETPSFKGTFWIAMKYPDGASILKQLQVMTPTSLNSVGGGVPNYRDFPGVPLRTKMSMGGKEVTSTITSIKQDSLNEADFTVPKDFQEIKMPDLENMVGGKPAPSPAPKP